ncbi:hypothetical protein TGAMA5MH_08955 [Trichoderma gamsii]|uniref:Glucose-methanol-choline oxidoreductase N-terminal domain-containing protein n=1 Tax=Trichoderma gamsii TaxID=398673 RepID=A0A2K0T0Q2_9HYPO|nr:hypothetical protein TGAMA5MH_08955 [Trichoderma gamsii]
MQTVSIDDFTRQSFDFIVVGGGTAGLAVASRLAQDGKFTVGVLEAGGVANGRDEVDIPGFFGRALQTDIDWKFETTPPGAEEGVKDNWPRGKALGGSSAINYMGWTRAGRADYDAWAQLGNAGWGWDDLLPFFKKSETFHPPSSSAQDKFDIGYDINTFGTSGPIHISYAEDYSQAHQPWLKGLNSLGVETNPAHFSGSNAGLWANISSVNPRTKTRSFATEYCSLAGSNLCILTEALVEEIVLGKADGGYVASGVRFTHNGQEHTVSASREIILSAGTIKSPQLLELSGVGNPEVLSRAGIDVKVDSPMVGENLQEHKALVFIVDVDPELDNPDDLILDAERAAAVREQYSRDKSGPLGEIASSYAMVPFTTTIQQDALEKIYSQAHALTELSPAKKAILEQRLRDPDNIGLVEYFFKLGAGAFGGKDSSHGILAQILQQPFAAGSIHVQAKSAAKEDPVIEIGYYHGPAGDVDLELMLQSTRFARSIMLAPPFNSVVKQPFLPPASVFDDDEQLKQLVLNGTRAALHAVGTCSMGGDAGISGGVVNERLQVYGVQRLRVVDASIMPLQISAHIQATVYAIAEKAAHMILEDAAVQ